MNHKFLQLVLVAFYLLSLVSCKKKEINYIPYYQKVNTIDSIYRIAGNSQLALEEYKSLFEKYEPKNQERIKEYETYVTLSDKYNIDFGGKKSLNKLILLIAPYGDYYKLYFPLFKKYGIDSTEVKEKISNWKKGLNQALIDSFTIAIKRDQYLRHIDFTVQSKNLKKNAAFLIWTFNKYGFPTPQKIGTMGHDNTLFIMPTFLTHMVESKEHYPYIRAKLYEYLKSGDCIPRDYALMIDAYHLDHYGIAYYSTASNYELSSKIDSAKINHHRKSIGLPSLKHTAIIKKNFLKHNEK
ncbi:hypothetical protein ACVVIH_19780 [Chryseobacterium arthrosphaerae]|uniref:hypothetical protein n=1 Tax=Chryseobacterium arthrosphaerae TaxID=651561 RepID=UPI003D342013